MLAFKKLVYTVENEDAFEQNFEDLKDSSLVAKYPNLVKYLDDVYELRKAWALIYRYV